MRKIAIFGPPATGKTTLARELSHRLALAHTALDNILFAPARPPLPLDEFRAQAAAVTAGDAWIVEGNFSKLADVVWHRADVLVWLDYPLRVIVRRIVQRSLRQLLRLEPGDWKSAFFGRRPMLKTAIRKYRKNRPRYLRQAQETAELGVEVVRLCTPGEAARWLCQI